jgi:hypothetical protein
MFPYVEETEDSRQETEEKPYLSQRMQRKKAFWLFINKNHPLLSPWL